MSATKVRPQFWFPQIRRSQSNPPSSLAPVWGVNQTLGFFGKAPIPYEDQGILFTNSPPLFPTEDIERYLEPRPAARQNSPLYVLGTLSRGEAQRKSWEELGLNLFDLPWGENTKAICYIPIHSLSDILKASGDQQEQPNDEIFTKAKNNLQWAKCHKRIQKILDYFAHGNRDDMQTEIVGGDSPAEIAKEKIDRLKQELESIDCPGECGVLGSLENIRHKIQSESDVPKCLRMVANLDCQTYRLASLPNLPLNENYPPYKRVIILEDHPDPEHPPGMREHLEQKLKVKYPGSTEIADVKKSLANYTFCRDDGKQIELEDEKCNEWDVKKGCNGRDTLVCLDLEIAPKENTYGIPGGLWFLYHTALHYPFASRLVITGYRSQDQKSFNAGAGAFLLKPFSDGELDNAIKASKPFSVLWICPDSVTRDWTQWASHLGQQKDYIWIKNQLSAWLGKFHIRLETASNYDESQVTPYSIVILDYYGILQPEHDYHEEREAQYNVQDTLVKDYLKLRSANPAAHILIILPMRDDIFGPSGALHSLGRILRDGQDVILHKPLWLYSDHGDEPGFGQTLLTTLKNRPKFNVKYVVLTPIMGLLWPKAKAFIESQTPNTDEVQRQRINSVVGWSPLGVLMGEIWGFTSSFKDILQDPRLSLSLLSKELDKERKVKNEQRWQNIHGEIKSDWLAEQFLTELLHPLNQISPHLTIERWLRAVLDKVFGGSGQKFLNHLFGGETRYEFGARGGWYDAEGTFVHDTPLVIEFCARGGILARKAIEKVIVQYLKDKGGEQRVLVQEIPIRGFLQ